MPQTPSTNPERKLPAGVGFAVTQLIDGGFLDDCLHLIAQKAMTRERMLARARQAGLRT